ncbi:Phosphatidylserine decarboxylase proenzyme 2 [Daldinia childiae]|uniref:Phosphatidylserine decarboxylase proenzyme 2 n=1 Tax=Daldinia childiae TaxID=326645 RepID=UPI001446423D|nr:Phosphatidylserine decarboxylase proenzyme 2 [Daldinia childiae]KAF3056551.1 Phosphatidylserine decarboxylase proenzyme 2 [Daldinia childiae]
MTTPKYDPLVQDLVNFVYRTEDRNQSFSQAVKSATDPKNGGDGEMSQENISTLEDYFRFCDDLLKWVPAVDTTVDTTDDALLRKLLVFYWVFNQPSVADYQTSIKPENAGSDPKWLSYWQVVYARALGSFLSTKESTSKIWTFYENPLYNQESKLWQDPPEPNNEWASFNQFFSRKWKDIDIARPLDQKENVIVSAADSKFGEDLPVEDGTVTIKGFYWTIKKLVQGSVDFNVVSFMHAFLGPTDYHRQHAPVSGRVVEAKVIQELVYLQVTDDPNHTGLAPDRGLLVKKPFLGKKRPGDLTAGRGHDFYDITAPDEPGYQWCQTRGVIVIETENHGKVAVLPIGMAQVSSVVLTVKENDVVEKGQEISYFQFGGSDIVLIFEKPVHYSVKGGDKCNVRSKIATFL